MEDTTHKLTKYNDWMGSDNEDQTQSQGQGGQAEDFEQTRFDGLSGHMRLQLEKTYGGDDRFKLTD